MDSDMEFIKGKVDVTAQMGERLDNMLEQTKLEIAKLRGGNQYLLIAINKTIPSLHKAIEDDISEKRISLDAIDSDLQLESIIKSYITKCSEALINLAETIKLEEVGAHGIAQGLKQSISVTQSMHNAAVAILSEPREAPKSKLDKRRKENGKG